MLEQQLEITKLFFDDQSIDSHEFVTNCIPDGARLLFEAKVESSNIFGKDFSFWFDSEGEGRVLLMTAKKSIKVGENSYNIQEYVDKIRGYRFLAKMSNSL